MAWSRRVLSACWSALFFCAATATILFSPTLPTLAAQTATPQRVYGSASVTATTSVIPGYEKDGATGTLAALPTAPFADRLEGGLVAIDGQGKFLFVLNQVSNNISMYQIDRSTGGLSEVPNSPFAAGPTINPNLAPSLPISLATEKNGNFLYVGYANGDSTTTSALIPFAIDAANLQIVLTPQLSLDFANGEPIQMLADPKGLRLYVGFGPDANQPGSAAGTTVFSIDPSNGVLTSIGSAGGGTGLGRAIAIDPQDRFFFDAWGQTEGFLDSGVINPVDGTSGATFTLSLGASVFPSVLLIESSGKFLYVQTGQGLLIYSINQTTGALSLVNGPLSSFAFGQGTTVSDPGGPFVYSLGHSGVDVFQVDPQTGNLVEIPGAPFSTGSPTALGGLGLAITGSATQNVSGPAVQLFPSSTDFGQATVGKTSITKIISVVNTGGQILTLNGIAITGASASDFAQSNTCGATLAVNANCSVSVLFTPSQAGAEQATLQVTDNAAGSPQGAALLGTGISSSSGVTISPVSLNFGSVIENANIAPQTIHLTNSGTSALHISAIALSGSNPGDFSQTSTCTAAPIAVQGTCVITVTFAPKAQAQRTASVIVTDDAANSPQSIALTGNVVSPFQILAAPSGSTSAAVTAGQVAQYALQLAPGPGYTGDVALSCSGAPAAASCSISPSTITVSGASATPFQVTVSTTGSALLIPLTVVGPDVRLWFVLFAVFVCLAILARVGKYNSAGGLLGMSPRTAMVVVAILSLLHVSGCGGAASSSPTPAVRAVTPKGTSIIVVTAKSGTLTPQTIQLTLTIQ